ncbi:hypothetical protein K438DRAFT_1993146 [Mycena galopus ATCC 62051]|nr:hypothetical protein K438DRAFT_1993146 [Mycena galopus ATCC 62051]
MPAHYRHHLRLNSPDFKLSIFENYLDRVLIGSLQIPEGKSLAAIYANWVPEAQILTVGLWSSNASPNSNNSATAASAPSTAYAEFAIVPRVLPCRRLREIMTTIVTSMNEQPTFDPPFHSRHLRFDFVFLKYLLLLLTRPFTRCNQFISPSMICNYYIARVSTTHVLVLCPESHDTVVPGQSHRPVLAKPTCGPDKSDTLARLRRHAGGVQEEFTADKGDVRVSSGADKGDVRVGSSADKGDVQMSRIKRDGVPLVGAKWGVGWARDGRGMGAGWARGGPLRDACSVSARGQT